MFPMKNYFRNEFLAEFLNWYHSNQKLTQIEALSNENASRNILIFESFYPSDGITPQTVIRSTQPIIKIIDKFLFEEKHFIAFKEINELRINMGEPEIPPRI